MGARGKTVIDRLQNDILESFLVWFSEAELYQTYASTDPTAKAPECPNYFLWALYNQMKRWDKLPEEGALLDQPYMLMCALEAVGRAVDARDRNRARREEQAKKAEAQARAFLGQYRNR